MSSVSGTKEFNHYQASLSDYQQRVDELTEEQQIEKKRTDERHARQLEALEKKHAARMAEKDDVHTRAIETAKQNANGRAESQERAQREELKRMQAQMYDRSGRLNAEIVDAKNEIRRVNEDWTARKEREEIQAERNDRTLENKFKELHEKASSDAERAANKAREAANQTLSALQAQDRGNYLGFKKQLEKKYQTMETQRQDEVAYLTKEMKHALDQQDRQHDMELKAAEEATQRRIASSVEVSNRRADRESESAREAFAAENTKLREQVRKLVGIERETQSARADARADAIREWEGERRAREFKLAEAYESQLQKTKEELSKIERRFGLEMDRNIREKGVEFAKTLQKTNQARFDEKKDLETQFERASNEMEIQLRREREQSDRALQRQAERAEGARTSALQTQAQAYQDTLSKQARNYKDQLNQMSTKLQESETTSDPTKVSPAAENAIRHSITEQYEKVLATEKDRNARDRDSLRSNLTQELSRVREDRDASVLSVSQKAALEADHSRTALLQLSEESELQKRQALQSKDDDHQKIVDNLQRTYAVTLDRQRRQYEELLQNVKLQSDSRVAAIRQESEFSERMLQRKSNADLTFNSREYEKKLAEQKALYDDLLNLAQEESEKKLRESEREKRLALEEQSRMHEQRTKEMELQSKERERTVTAAYEAQLDKVRQSNARLIQKKS
jgi:hypothetical protein